jgi:hypothetical protein
MPSEVSWHRRALVCKLSRECVQTGGAAGTTCLTPGQRPVLWQHIDGGPGFPNRPGV